MELHLIKTRFDEATLREVDGWRRERTPVPSRSKAIHLLVREGLAGWRRPAAIAGPQRLARPSEERLTALYVLQDITGFGPAKFRQIHKAGITPEEAIRRPERLPITGKTGEKLRAELGRLFAADVEKCCTRAREQLKRAEHYRASILTHGDAEYPTIVYKSNNPVPVLYVRGDPTVWTACGSVAVVGSRHIREPYTSLAKAIAEAAAQKGIAVVSGFALGADSIGHRAAKEFGGRTICVMPCGLDKVFPPENRELWEDLLQYPKAVFVSEFGFGQRASALHLRKRNKLVVSFSQGIVVTQSAVDGGAMNAYRCGREQKKQVVTFEADASKETSGNAVVAADSATGGVTFSCEPATSEYGKWLEELSSST